MVRHGTLSPAEAAKHHFRHVITNVVGGRELGITVETHKIRLGAGDLMLLCSDGLTEMMTDEQIAAILHNEPTTQSACERLVQAANDHGGKDNITVVAARFTDDA
jgi:protein phosphatase